MKVVNTHVHTPYSFSSFDSVEQAVKLAREENIAALGINDFNTFEGFDEFGDLCTAYGVYPLYNVEFITLSHDDKSRNFRWNDPKNPGIMYFCGKALKNPVPLTSNSKNFLGSLWKGTQDHIWKVISKVNEVLASRNVAITIDYNRIRTMFAKNMVRERHVAKAIYLESVAKWHESSELLKVFRAMFDDPTFTADLPDTIFMQNEIRNRLLKAGAPAYVEEKIEAFPSLDQVKTVILEGGGIPCYPILADDKAGLTEAESTPAVLSSKLKELGIHAVEFIPSRNSFDHLKKYALHFYEQDFCVTFGTEHNTPERMPLVPTARGGRLFDDELSAIAYEGACILAAHQEMRHQNQSGFVDSDGIKTVSSRQIKDFIRLGEEAMKKVNK